MNHDHGDEAARIRRTLAGMHVGLAAFYQTIADGIDRLGERDPQAAFDLASEHQAALRQFHGQEEARASRLRAAQAMRIRDREALSLSKLADRVGMSKSRAAQLVNLAKEPEEATP
jgi:DNA-binding transcriptional regulator YiaG